MHRVQPEDFEIYREILEFHKYEHGFSFKKDSEDEQLFWEKFLPISKELLPDPKPKRIIPSPKR